MVFNRHKERAGENIESPARTQSGKNIHEGSNPRRTVFTREKNDLFIRRVLQYSQEKKSDELHYHLIVLNESSTDDDIKKDCRSLVLRFHPDKNHHSQVTEVMKMINEAKEESESTLRHNIEIMEKEHVRMDAMREQERVHMAQNAVIIASDDESDPVRREILSKPVTLSNKVSTFPAEHKYDNEETPLKKN